MWPCIARNFFIIKPTRCTNFTNLFWHETLHVSDSSSVHHQEFIHCTLSNGVCLQKFMTYTIAEFTMKNSWWWTEELSETCRVWYQNKFVKLVHLVGFITKTFTFISLLYQIRQFATDVTLFAVSFAQPLLNVTQSPALALYSHRQPQSCSTKIHQN